MRYVRDVTDRIVERKVGGVTVERYSYSAGGALFSVLGLIQVLN